MAPGKDGEGLFAALRNLLAALLASGRMRLELLGIEIQEERIRLLGLLALGVGALFLLGLGIVLLIVFFAVVFWEQRVAVFGISALLAVGGGFLLLGRLKRQAAQPSQMFQASLAELDADLASLSGRAPPQP